MFFECHEVCSVIIKNKGINHQITKGIMEVSH